MPRRDQTAFADFALARSAALHRSAYLMVGDAQLAQDLVQEALVKTYVAWPRLRDPAKAEAYARRAVTTTAIDWFRRRRWSAERPTEAVPEPAGGALADDVTTREWLWRQLGQLPPRQRAAVVLRYYEDLTEADTAAALGCAVGTVKSQVAAALAKLRAALGDDAASVLPLPAAENGVRS